MSGDFDLRNACLEGHTNIILRHLDSLAPDDEEVKRAIEQPDADRRTPLHWAASQGLTPVVQAFLSRGAEVDRTDPSRWTALMMASSAGHLDIVKLLLQNGANAVHQNEKGQTALHYAASKGHVDVGRALMEFGPGGGDINARDRAKQCAIHRAASAGKDSFIRMLLKPPAPRSEAQREKTRVNPADRLGNTPLHLAMDSGHGSTAVLLIEEAGVDQDRVNQDGQRPMEMEGVGGLEQKRIVDYIRSHVG